MPRLVPLLPLFIAIPLIAAEPPQSPARRPIAQVVPRTTKSVGTPQLASDGSGFFGVWSDELYDVSGARFSDRGEILDATEFPVVTTWHGGEYPAVAWNGRAYAVLGSAGPLGVFAVRVTTDGQVIPGPGPFPDLFPQQPPSLAWNGSTYAYAAVDGYSALRVAFLDPNLSATKVVRLGEGTNVRCAQVASDGSGFLVLWEATTEREDIAFVQRFDASGEPSRPPQQVRNVPRQPGGVLRPAMAWNGNHYFVVWTAGSVEGILIAGDGTLERPFTVSQEDAARDVAVGWDGFAHLVTWSHKTDEISPQGAIVNRPAAALTTSMGEVLERIPLAPALSDFLPPDRATIASNGSVFLVIWSGERFVVSSTADPHVQAHFEWITKRYRSQQSPAVAAGSSNLLAAWREGDIVYAGRLSKRGDPLDGSGIALGRMRFGGNIGIAWTDGVYLIWWSGGDASLGAVRLTESGTMLDTEPLALSTVYAANPKGFRFVWSRWIQTPFPGRLEIVTAEIPARGAVDLQISQPLFPAQLTQTPSFLIWTGDAYTLLWRQTLSNPCSGLHCPPEQFENRATILDKDGRPLSTRTLLPNVTVLDAVQASDDTLLIAFLFQGLVTQRIASDGELIGNRNVVPAGPLFYNVRLVKTPAGFVLINNTQLIHLDRNGAPLSQATNYLEGQDMPRIVDVAGDGPRIWITYTVGWRPRPTTTSTVSRAYLYTIGPRTRIASR